MKTIIRVIEPLESRIAPAALATLHISPDKRSATYTDVDGDLVTVKVSTGNLDNAIFTGVAVSAGHEQLQTLDLTGAGTDHANVTFTVKKVAGGNGFANVGYINSTGHDLGVVTVKGDLGQIDAGDTAEVNSLGIKGLAVNSLGQLNTDTQDSGNANFGLESDIVGGLGSLTVTHDVQDAFVNVTALGTPASGTIGPIKIGGSLIGGTADDSGEIKSSGKMGAVTITENLLGGSGARSGMLNSASDLGAVTIGGSILGGNLTAGNTQSGAILALGNIVSLKVTHDVIYGSGNQSGYIQAGDISISQNPLGKLLGLTIGGSLIGNSVSGGTVESANLMGPIKIAGSLVGGLINSAGDIGAVSVGGSILPGTITSSGVISCAGNMGFVTIGHDIQGTSVSFSGLVFSGGNIVGAKVGGSIIGGPANIAVGVNSTGGIEALGDLGPVTVAHDLLGGKNGTSTGTINGMMVTPHDLSDSGFISANGRIASVAIGGSILAGGNFGTGTIERSGSITAGNDLGLLTVAGSIVGNRGNGGANTPVFIAARGQTIPKNGIDLAIGKITVAHRLENAQILAGFSFDPAQQNADAQIGAVTVSGDWIATSIVAGAQNLGGDHAVGGGDDNVNFGNNDDALYTGHDTATFSKIASITIKGTLIGTPVSTNSGDQFGFVAEQIGAVKIGGSAIVIPTNNTPLPIGETTDMDIHLLS